MNVSYYIEGLLRQMTAQLARDYLGIVGPAGTMGIEGGFFRFNQSNSAADPGKGKVSLDAGTWAATTAIYFDILTENDVDATSFLKLVDSGDVLLIQDRDDATSYGRFMVNGPPVDNGGWFTIPVAHVKSGGNVPKNNAQIAVVVSYT